jgi:hypothetical protein
MKAQVSSNRKWRAITIPSRMLSQHHGLMKNEPIGRFKFDGAKTDSVATFQKRVQDELAAVENEISERNQQIEALNKRL